MDDKEADGNRERKGRQAIIVCSGFGCPGLGRQVCLFLSL